MKIFFVALAVFLVAQSVHSIPVDEPVKDEPVKDEPVKDEEVSQDHEHHAETDEKHMTYQSIVPVSAELVSDTVDKEVLKYRPEPYMPETNMWEWFASRVHPLFERLARPEPTKETRWPYEIPVRIRLPFNRDTFNFESLYNYRPSYPDYGSYFNYPRLSMFRRYDYPRYQVEPTYLRRVEASYRPERIVDPYYVSVRDEDLSVEENYSIEPYYYRMGKTIERTADDYGHNSGYGHHNRHKDHGYGGYGSGGYGSGGYGHGGYGHKY